MTTRPSPKLRPTWADALVILSVAALAMALAVFQWLGGDSGTEADRFAPEELLEQPRTYTSNGYTLTVTYGVDYEDPSRNALPPSGKSGLRVAFSDCPTQDCVRTGTISRGGQSIVCLPARIIVRLEGGPGDPAEVDAVLG